MRHPAVSARAALVLTAGLLACPAVSIADQPYYLTAEPNVARVKQFDFAGAFDSTLVAGAPGQFTANHFCVGPDRERLFVPTYQGTRNVQVFDLQTGAFIEAIDHPQFVAPAWVGLAPGGELVISDFDGGRVWLYDLKTKSFTGELVESGHLFTAHTVLFNDDGTILVLDWWGGQIVRYFEDGSFDRILNNGPSLLGPLDMVPSPDGTRLYVTNNAVGNVVMFDRATGDALGTLLAPGVVASPEGMIYGHDGSLLVTSGPTGRIQRVDATSGAFLGTFLTTSGYCVDIVLVPARCPSDLGDDGATDFIDLLQLLGAWGTCAQCPEDLDGDGEVGFTDLLVLISGWGPC